MENTTGRARPVITLLILVYDGTAEERFPYKRQWYRFDYDKATDDESAAVLLLASPDGHQEAQHKEDRKPGQTTVRMSLSGGGAYTGEEILQYRHLFEPVDDPSVFSKEVAHADGMMVSAPDSYLEDENGTRISVMEIFDREAQREGGEDAISIVYDHPETILRLGPAAPIRPKLWSEGAADLLAHLFSTHGFLVGSRWLGSRCEVSPSKAGADAATLPLHEDCMSVILPFRKLYSNAGMDNLFNRSCAIHSRHCHKHGPHFSWVRYYNKAFNTYLDGEPKALFVKTTISTRRYLDAVAYGAGIVHATSNNTPHSDFKALRNDNAKELVVFGYHFILHTLLRYVDQAVQIMRQDAHHWVNDLGWAQPSRLAADEFFGDPPCSDS